MIENRTCFSIKYPAQHSVVINIKMWDFLMAMENDTIFIWHHVTKYDGGYGDEVKVEIKKEYFEQHNWEEIYDEIGNMVMTPTSYTQRVRNTELSNWEAHIRYFLYHESQATASDKI